MRSFAAPDDCVLVAESSFIYTKKSVQKCSSAAFGSYVNDPISAWSFLWNVRAERFLTVVWYVPAREAHSGKITYYLRFQVD